MDENSLKQLWLNTSTEQRVEINIDLLIESITQKILKMKKQIKSRDAREIFLSICMILLFGWLLIVVPMLLAKIGAAIIIAGCILVIFRLINASKINLKDDKFSEIKLNLMVSLQRVRKQKKLLGSVLWWYLLPFFIGVNCFYYAYAGTITSKVIYTIIVAALYGYIYWLNQRAIQKHLNPLEEKILKALNELSEEDSGISETK